MRWDTPQSTPTNAFHLSDYTFALFTHKPWIRRRAIGHLMNFPSPVSGWRPSFLVTIILFSFTAFFFVFSHSTDGTKSMSMALLRELLVFPLSAFHHSDPLFTFFIPPRSPPPTFAEFQDYDENLTSAKVVSVRHISHFSRHRLENAFFRFAKSGPLAVGWLQKSLFRHPCERVTSPGPNLHVNWMKTGDVS